MSSRAPKAEVGMFELLLAVGIVIVTSALCSLFEAVLYSVPASHVEGLVQAESRAGKVLQALRRDVDSPITAILTLNTVANTAGAAVAGAIAVRVLGGHWLAWFSGAFTVAILLFSEVIPKTAGVVYARPLASIVAFPLKLLVWVFKPAIYVCGLVTRVITGERREHQVSPQELAVMARMGLRTGGIEEDEAAVIQNILSLRSKVARDVLTPRTVVYALREDTLVEEAAQDMRIYHHSRIPVFSEDLDDVTGIAIRGEVLAALADGKGDTAISALVSAAHFVLETDPLSDVFRAFLERRQHMFVVIDDFGALAGVITLEDVLEEILGREIVDESDEVADMRDLARKRRDELLKRGKPAAPAC